MAHCYNYAVAQFVTDPLRNERLNLGIVVFKEKELEVSLPRSLDKLRAISGALDLELVRAALERLTELDAYALNQGLRSATERLESLNELAPVKFSSLGVFYNTHGDQYRQHVERLLQKLVEPEPAPIKTATRKPTKLLADVKLAFRSEKVLARKGEGLETHRIVANYKVAEGLAADLFLQNGAMHVVQTVDASSEDASVRRMISDIAVSALVFEQARMNFGEAETKSRLVYRATSSLEGFITPSLEAAEHQGASLINWASRDDRTKFIVELSSLAEPAEGRGTKALDNVHASVLPKSRLN